MDFVTLMKKYDVPTIYHLWRVCTKEELEALMKKDNEYINSLKEWNDYAEAQQADYDRLMRVYDERFCYA